jgi:hypothetical protein
LAQQKFKNYVTYAMLLSETDFKNQEELKLELQNESRASKFENLSAALLGRLLGVPIAVAKSGFQHGGDAGPAGRQGRRFRLECKKYSDSTSLSDRELLGEIDHALSHDEALEAWFLIATRSVSEQLEQTLVQKGERIGVPVVILDWKQNDLASMAALCSFAPDLVESEFSTKGGELALALQPTAADAISVLRRDLQSWCLGYEALRDRSHEKLQKIWNSPRASNSDIGQNAAGGAQAKKVKRNAVHKVLTTWWNTPPQADSPAAVIGWDGVGKTWATLDWLVTNLNEQPIVLVVPSSALAALTTATETNVKRFLADRLYEITGVRTQDHWLRRLDYLLKRPVEEGPALTIFFDGLNQEPSAPWLALLKVLQGDTFAGRIRVIISTRKHHFEDKLSMLRGLVVPVVSVAVDTYDTEAGGELDQMLAFEELARSDLHPELIELARTPRLFMLVVRFRERLIEAGQVTVHRLLWEYGRDTLGERSGKSFSEEEWRAWLKEISKKFRDGNHEYSVKSLGETASRPDLTERDVYARLSDIIDGRFARQCSSGNLQLTPTVVAHALGASLLAHLDAVTVQTFEALNADITSWLDPIAGLDQRAEILRAAVSILVEQGEATTSPIAGVLVTSWLQTQNVTDNHRQELAGLASILTNALLDAIENSDGNTHASARLWGVNALRSIPRTNTECLATIVMRLSRWFRIVSRDLDLYPNAGADIENNRSEKFKSRIGIDASVNISVVGVELELVDRHYGVLQSVAPSILERIPLAMAMSVFEAASVALAVRGSVEGWDGLKWLCLLNEIDPDETAIALRQLSDAILYREPEPGVHQSIPARVAALILFLSGQEIDEISAIRINPQDEGSKTYENDYLPNPSRSYFSLERRHAFLVLNDTELPLRSRVQRTKELWFDPTFQPTEGFVAEIRAIAEDYDVDKLNQQASYTIQDHDFEEIEPVFARCAPDLLARLMRRKLQGLATLPVEARYWSGIHVTDGLLLAGDAEAAAANKLRLNGADANQQREDYVASQLLMVELQGLNAVAQIDAVIKADLKIILRDFTQVMCTPTSQEVDTLITQYLLGSTKQKNDLLLLLSIRPRAYSEFAWLWIADFAKQSAHELRHVAFKTLASADAIRFGRLLSDDNWQWSADSHYWVNHFGSGALIEGTRAIPFDQIAPRIAPWRLLEAARLRGADPAEVRLASGIVGRMVLAEKLDAPDMGSTLTVDVSERSTFPSTFSVSARPIQDDAGDPSEAFKRLMDFDARAKDHQRATETAMSRISNARASGANLFLSNIDPEDFEPVLRYAEDMVDNWIDGFNECSMDFRRRVHLADGTYLALCEALLAFDPVRGVQLWKALRKMVTVRYVGIAEIDELLLMLFRAPDSEVVTALRDELSDKECSGNDQALFHLAMAASINGKQDWLAKVIENGKTSAHIWKKESGKVLEGFAADNALPVEGAWPDAEVLTDQALLEQRTARFRWSEACAHYWWKSYIAAQNTDVAFAAWVLFLRSADHRALIWMHRDVDTISDSSQLLQLKLSHIEINRSNLKRAMGKHTEKLNENFLNRKIVQGIGPWVQVSE